MRPSFALALLFSLTAACGGTDAHDTGDANAPDRDASPDGQKATGNGVNSCAPHPASCVCVCADADAGCENPTCSFSEIDCFGPGAGCPADQVCRAFGEVCTPLCDADGGGCPAGMTAQFLIP